jgi:hypothetical protein
MKTIFKCPNHFWFALALCALVFSGCSLFYPKPTPDPLTGFHRADEADMDKNKAITDDYKDYIQKLSPKWKKYFGPILYFEDGTGQHAVQIETDINGDEAWYHILFYDKDNKRIKVVKYFYGRYRS